MTRYLTHALLIGLLAAAGLILPATATAQACAGVPIGRGQFGLAGEVGFTEGARSYGVNLTGNLPGPITASVGYALADYEDVDPNSHGFGGRIVYELPVSGASICPGVGGSYIRISESVSTVTGKVTQTTAGAGLGVGRTFTVEDSNLGITIFAFPQFLYIRTRAELSEGNISVAETDDRGEFGMGAGVTLDVGAVFFGGSVLFTTTEDSDPTFSVGIGIRLGSER